MVELGRGSKPARRLIDLTGLEDELRFCRVSPQRIEIGALTTHQRCPRIRRAPRRRAPAGPRLRRGRGTGDPHARNDRRERRDRIARQRHDLRTGRARRRNRAGECRRQPPFADRRLLHRLSYHRTRAGRARARDLDSAARDAARTFLKLGLRRAQAIAVINVAVVVGFDGTHVNDVRIALGCVGPTIVRAPSAERSLIGMMLDRNARTRRRGTRGGGNRTDRRRRPRLGFVPPASPSQRWSNARSRRSRTARRATRCRNHRSCSKHRRRGCTHRPFSARSTRP